MKRLQTTLFAVAAICALVLTDTALAQTIHIDINANGKPEFADRNCPGGDKGDMCPPKNTPAPTRFQIRGVGNTWSIERIDLFGMGPNTGSAPSNPQCYQAAVPGCGGLVPHTYCPGSGTATEPYRVDIDFTGARDTGSACTMACSGTSCVLDNRNVANWKWRYEVWVREGAKAPVRVDPIITNRGTGRN